MMVVGRQLQGDELLAQLRELLFSPPSPTTPPPCPCHDGRRRRGSKRGRRDDGTNNNGQQDHDEPAAARHSCKTRRTKNKQQQKSRSLVTSVPDFDGYQWRKYGQKQIEGALYARSYYRCTRSAEQGCPAKRTVQRNDDKDTTTYTVVYMGEHTCSTANEEAPPVILETAAAVPAYNTSSTPKQQRSCYDEDDDPTITSADESPAISDITWSSSSNNGLLGAHDNDSWASSLQDFISGPIRSPLHIPAPDAWMLVDGLLGAHDYFLIDDAAAGS